MVWKFTLSHEILGTKVISEPDGYKESKLTLERHADFASLVEHFTGDFIFYGFDGENDGGIDFIREVESTYGVDAYLGILIELAPDNYTFETVFQGQLDLSTITEMFDNKAQVAIIRDDFWAKFINRFDTQVNIQSEEDLDGNPVVVFDHINMVLTPQPIRSMFWAELSELSGYAGLGGVTIGSFNDTNDTNRYVQFDWDKVEFDELLQKYNLSIESNPLIPASIFFAEYGGDYTIDLKITAGDYAFSPIQGIDQYFEVYIQFGNNAPIALTKTPVVTVVTAGPTYDNVVVEYSYTGTVALLPGDSIKIYGDRDNNRSIIIYFQEDQSTFSTPFFAYNYLHITANTIFPQSNSNSFFVHDVGGSISDRIIGQQETFYSEYLGNENTKYRQYEEAGCASNYGQVQGLQLRGYSLTEKQYSLSMKKWWEGINPIQNLSLMYDEVDGQPVIRVEEKEHCFEDGDTSINIPYVREITRKYDPDSLIKTVKTGYKKWESDDSASGLDIPQTKHTYATQLKRTGKDLVLESEFIAGDLTIETTRRKTREKTADFKYDNDSFIIKLEPNPSTVSPDVSPDIDDYLPELNDVTGVTGLLNEETRYNKLLTPARALLRWLKFLSGAVYQYPGSLFKYTYGEGNYEMEATATDSCEPNPETLAENQDIVADSDPVYLPFDYEFTDVPLDYSDYVTIRDNRKKAIGISQTDEGFTKFYIKKLVYDQTKGLATINAWPKTFMDILVIEGDFSKEPCEPEELPSGCYRITEDGLYRVTEDGSFRILEDC